MATKTFTKPPETPQDNLTLREAAKWLRTSERSLSRNILTLKKRGFPAFKVGHNWVISKKLMAEWVERQAAKLSLT